MEDITTNLDEHNPSHLVALDFSKAYDTVWHAGLVYKLYNYYGIKGRTLFWINSFLTTRITRVVSEGNYSEWGLRTQGLPQGSGMSPVLYILYTNDYRLMHQERLSMGTFATQSFGQSHTRNLSKRRLKTPCKRNWTTSPNGVQSGSLS